MTSMKTMAETLFCSCMKLQTYFVKYSVMFTPPYKMSNDIQAYLPYLLAFVEVSNRSTFAGQYQCLCPVVILSRVLFDFLPTTMLAILLI